MSLRVRTTLSGPQGAPWMSTMNFQGTTLTNAQDAADAVRSFWLALQGILHATVTVAVQPEVLIINDVTGEPEGIFNVTAPATFVGSGGQPLLPAATQGLVRWRTGVFSGGREIRGRTFIPGLTQVSNDQGNVAAGTVNTIALATAALIADPDANLGVYSKAHGTLAVVNAASLWSRFAVLRTRRD